MLQQPHLQIDVFFIWLGILLFALAASAVILWRRYQSRQQLVQRIAELESLSDAGRAIVASQLDVDALCELIAKEAGRITDNRTFQIGLFEESRYVIHQWTIGGIKQETPKTLALDDDGGLVRWILNSRQSILVNDFSKEFENLPARPFYVNQSPPRSALFLPMISGQDVLGIITVQSNRPKAFSQSDLGRLTILANQAAAAIANARIYQKERVRATHLELVGQIAQQVNAISDLEELLHKVVFLTGNTFGFSSVNVFDIDSLSGKAIIQASTIAQLQPGQLCLAPGEGLVGTAISKKETSLSNNTYHDERFLPDNFSEDTRSEIAIPLIVNEDLLGVLDVQSNVVGAFTEQERMVLEALAAQVAIAIHKARQYAIQRRQNWITTAQLQVAETINESPDLESLAASIVRLTALLIGADEAAILLWDDDFQAYYGAAIYGLPSPFDERFHRMAIRLGDWKALDATHVGRQLLMTQQRPPWSTDTVSGGAFTLLPLLSQGNMKGVMVVRTGKSQKGDLENSRDELLRNIASQSAQAIDTIQLQLAQQEEAWVNTALLQVAEAVNRLTDLNEILYTIVRMVPMLVGVESCVVLVRDDENKVYRAGPSHGISEMAHGLLESFEVDLSEFLLLKTRDIERVGPEATFYTFKLPAWMKAIMNTETADIFPLYARARLVGALVVGPTANSRPLAGRRLNIVSGIAQQAAVAVVNNQLYKESAERARMEQELDVARSIQASLIPEGNPEIPGCSVASHWQAARQVSGDFYDFMQLSENRWGIAIADVADKGIPAALYMALSRTILRTVAFNRRSPAEVLQRTNQIIYGDTTSDHFVTIFYAVWDNYTKKLTFASGGHNPPVKINRKGQVSYLRSNGIALGVLEEVQIEERETRLNPGDTIIFYTDGVTEAMNEDFDEFGLERLCLTAESARQGPAADIVKAITEAIAEHAGDTPQFDDVTLVIMKR